MSFNLKAVSLALGLAHTSFAYDAQKRQVDPAPLFPNTTASIVELPSFTEDSSSIEIPLSTGLVDIIDQDLTESLPPVFTSIEVTSEVVADVEVSSSALDIEISSELLETSTPVTEVLDIEETVTPPPEAPEVETIPLVSTQIVQQPSVIVVKQVTFFVFGSALGGLCPVVQPAPAPPAVPGQPAPSPDEGSFVVDDEVFTDFPQACLAACNVQFSQCQSLVGPGLKLTQCQTQLAACQNAAATATIVVPVPTTITQTVVVPPEAIQTDAPAVTSKIIDAGGEVITTTVLHPDEAASVGPSGVIIITVTAPPTPEPEAPEDLPEITEEIVIPPVSTDVVVLQPSGVAVPPEDEDIEDEDAGGDKEVEIPDVVDEEAGDDDEEQEAEDVEDEVEEEPAAEEENIGEVDEDSEAEQEVEEPAEGIDGEDDQEDEVKPPAPIASVVTITLPPNPAEPGVPQISTATITIHPSAAPAPPKGAAEEEDALPLPPQESVVTVTIGDQTGVITMTASAPAAPPALPTNIPGCPLCQEAVTVTETLVLTETVALCEADADATVAPGEETAVVIETEIPESLIPQPSELPEKPEEVVEDVDEVESPEEDVEEAEEEAQEEDAEEVDDEKAQEEDAEEADDEVQEEEAEEADDEAQEEDVEEADDEESEEEELEEGLADDQDNVKGDGPGKSRGDGIFAGKPGRPLRFHRRNYRLW